MKNYINILEENNELIRIKEYINPELEITEITDRVSKSEEEGKLCYLKIPEQHSLF